MSTYRDPAEEKRAALEAAEAARAKLDPRTATRKIRADYSVKPLQVAKPWAPGQAKPVRP